MAGAKAPEVLFGAARLDNHGVNRQNRPDKPALIRANLPVTPAIGLSLPDEEHMTRAKRSRKKRTSRRRSNRRPDYIPRSRMGFDQKMSQVLLDFVEPYKQFAETPEAIEKLVVIGIAAWNASMLPEQQRDSTVANLAMSIVKGNSLVRRVTSKIRTAILGESRDVAEFKQLVYELIERKLQYYPEIKRLIVSYELSPREDDIHLIIVSTLTAVG